MLFDVMYEPYKSIHEYLKSIKLASWLIFAVLLIIAFLLIAFLGKKKD